VNASDQKGRFSPLEYHESRIRYSVAPKYLVPILYRQPAFEALGDLVDFLESIRYSVENLVKSAVRIRRPTISAEVSKNSRRLGVPEDDGRTVEIQGS